MKETTAFPSSLFVFCKPFSVVKFFTLPRKQKGVIMRPVDIDEVCAAMEENSYEEYNYIDLETGEVVTVFEYNDFPENEELREAIEKEPERYIGIPSIPSHEFYRYMEEFIGTVSNETMRRKLGIAIQQRRPFRRFKDTVAQDPEEEIRWYEFRNNEIKREAIEWLEAEGIEWEEVYKMPTAEEKISEKEESIKEEIKSFVEETSKINYVVEISLLGSIRRGKRVGADIDLAVFIKTTDNINSLARVYRKAYGKYHHSLDVFVLREDRTFLGHICYRRGCPVQSIDCIVRGCGAIKYVRWFQDFEFDEKKFLKDRPKVLWLNPKRKKSISDEWVKETPLTHD